MAFSIESEFKNDISPYFVLSEFRISSIITVSLMRLTISSFNCDLTTTAHSRVSVVMLLLIDITLSAVKSLVMQENTLMDSNDKNNNECLKLSNYRPQTFTLDFGIKHIFICFH